MRKQGSGLAVENGPTSGAGKRSGQVGVLGALRINLSPLGAFSLIGNGGEALHGLFVSLVGRRNDEWNTLLHRQEGPKPFSLSPLEGCQRQYGRSVIASGQEVFFRVGLLDTNLLADAMAAFYEAKLDKSPLALGKATVLIEEVERDQSSSFLSFQELLEGAAEETKITLEFLSPTTFKVEDNSFPLPLPELVFSSLLKHWCTFSSVPLPPGMETLLSSIKVSRYELRTELVQFARFKAIGFTGRVVYELPSDLQLPVIQAFNCLADFASYSGVGWKTTMSMGQTRRIDHARPLPDRTGCHAAKRRRAAQSHEG